MKILYIAHVFEDSGYGRACRNYALAMDKAGVDVVIRPVIFNKAKEIPKRILELCDKSTDGCNINFQFLLPEYSEYDGRFDKNIFFFEKESKYLKSTGWPRKADLFDEVWVPNLMDEQTLKEDGITKPIFRIGHPEEVKINPHTKLDDEDVNSTYTFYFIGEFSRRKNIPALLKAFHLEFGRNEPVSLLLKVNKSGESRESLYKLTTELCSDIKKALKLYQKSDLYKKELVITDYLPEDGLAAIHNSCDCFVSASYGEAWQFPAFEAAAYGNEVIANGHGPEEFLPTTALLPDYKEQFCFGALDTLENLHTGREVWSDVNIKSLQRCMRQVYEMSKDDKVRLLRAEKFKESVKKFSFEAVGQSIKERLLN